jgi:hypothetical protein
VEIQGQPQEAAIEGAEAPEVVTEEAGAPEVVTEGAEVAPEEVIAVVVEDHSVAIEVVGAQGVAQEEETVVAREEETVVVEVALTGLARKEVSVKLTRRFGEMKTNRPPERETIKQKVNSQREGPKMQILKIEDRNRKYPT